MIGRQSTKTSTQGATPTRSLLFVPSRIRAPSGALTLTPISLCRLPTGTTMRELVTSDRSVEVSLCRQPLAAAANMLRIAKADDSENSNANSESHSQALSDQVRVPGAMRSGCCP